MVLLVAASMSPQSQVEMVVALTSQQSERERAMGLIMMYIGEGEHNQLPLVDSFINKCYFISLEMLSHSTRVSAGLFGD